MAIRLAVKADIPRILEIYSPYVLKTTYSFEYTVPTLEAFTRRFEEITARFPWLVYEENGELLGYAYGSAPFDRAAYQWMAEASVYLSESAHRRGIGRKLYSVLEEILQQQGFVRVYALVTEENTGSLDFHRAVGYRDAVTFERCGYKQGRWLGVIWLEKTLNSVESNIQPPIRVEEIGNIDRFFR